MQLNEDLLKRIAKNARLELSNKEVDEFLPQLKEVLDVFSRVSEVNTDNTELAVHPLDLKNAAREDKAEESISQELALKNTEHKKDGYFKGPKVV